MPGRAGIMRCAYHVIWLSLLPCVFGADWPTYRHDMRRSGCTAERIEPRALELRWVWRSNFPPSPAWAGPARWDAYHKIRPLKSMRNYDVVFHPAVAGDSLWFASSADNTLYCLDAVTGAVRWTFTVDAAIRTTPTWNRGRVYFGADDGYAYCLDAGAGRLLWKFSPKPPSDMVLHDGRPISFWPCRTTPVVLDDTVYFGMALLPWKKSYLCALDAATGKPDGPGRYVRELNGATFEGPLAASTAHLVSPQGRVPPLIFDRRTGAALGQLQYSKKKNNQGGGCFVLLTAEGEVFGGPGSKTGWVAMHNVKTRDKMAVFQGGNALVIAGDIAYLLSDDCLTAMHRKNRKRLWRTSCNCPYEVIYAGGVLFAGGMDRVTAFDAETGTILWRGRVHGRAYGLAAANGCLYVSTDAGNIYCFASSPKPSAKYADLLEVPHKTHAQSAPPLPPDKPPSDPALFGRWLFRRDHIGEDGVVRDSTGRHPGKILGNAEVVRVGKREALRLNGSADSVRVSEDAVKIGLPTEAVTVTAWVRVDRDVTWGGIVGAFQDNGDYERGWVLGYNGRNYSFAVKAVNGPGRLTYLKAREPFEPEHWYFVAGTYDGAKLRVFVNGRLSAESADQKGPIDYPPQAFLEIGAYHDDDEYNRLEGMIHEVRIYTRALTPEEILAQYKEKSDGWPQPPPPRPGKPVLELAAGPWVRYTDRTSAVVRWFSHVPMTSTLIVSAGGQERRIRETAPGVFHEVRLDRLERNRIYLYTIEAVVQGKVHAAGPFELDTVCNYTVPPVPADLAAEMETGPCAVAAARLAGEILDVGKRRRGICFVLGLTDGRLSYAIIRRSEFRIIGLDTDAARVAAARDYLVRAGVYGVRATVLHVSFVKDLPFNGLLGNLVLIRRPEFLPAGERLVEPYGVLLAGALRCPQPETDGFLPGCGVRFQGIPRDAQIVEEPMARWVRWERPALPGSGVWTHQYGRADNSAFGGETLQGAASTRQLAVQWLGRPGPRARPDRNGRISAPLAVAGRLFSPGLNRMIALDVYNGSVLWSLEIPGFLRCNIAHDCSNWCADSAHVYAAVADKCWRISAADGVVDKFFDVVAGPRKDWKWEWSYIARPEDTRLLIGSATKVGTSFKNFWGRPGWYDAVSGPLAAKVASDNLFALDADTGRRIWTYTNNSVLINSTITIADGRVWFVACRNPKVVEADTRRCAMPELWSDLFLVCLDLETGRRLWEKPLQTAPGTAVFFLAYGSGRLVLPASDKKYHVYGFDAESGEALWTTEFDWFKDNHGFHMSRPAVVGYRVYVRPRIIDLNSGKILEGTMPLGACGTYAFSEYAAVYRCNGCVSIWDVTRDKAEPWPRLRPDCWLSTIPACGMLLSPEAGGGCSCGAWMETSLGFIPVGSLK